MDYLQSPPPYMVHVRCMTFNHGTYIEDAMNGFCMQETNFSYVCTIMDDASTDGEQEIIKKYLQLNFNLEDTTVTRIEETDDYLLTFAQHKKNKNCYFAVFYLKYNHYQNYDLYNFRRKRDIYLKEWQNTPYLASCEGDDYWIDSRKLQKQFDFLESHPIYSMCFSRAKVLFESKISILINCFDIEDREYNATEIFEKWIIPTATTMIRRKSLEYPINGSERVLNGDIVTFEQAAHSGKVRGMSDYMAIYRIHQSGVTYNPAMYKIRIMRAPEHYVCIKENFPKIDNTAINKVIASAYADRTKICDDKKLIARDRAMIKRFVPKFFEGEKRRWFLSKLYNLGRRILNC